MKTILVLASLLSAGATAPAFANDFKASAIPREIVANLDSTTLDELLSRNRVSTGMERATVLEQLGEPGIRLHRDVWVFTGFRASNVYGAERYDALVVVFKGDKVDRVTLSKESALRTAAATVARARTTGEAVAQQ